MDFFRTEPDFNNDAKFSWHFIISAKSTADRTGTDSYPVSIVYLLSMGWQEGDGKTGAYWS